MLLKKKKALIFQGFKCGSEGRIAPLHTYVFAFLSRSSALPTAILSSRFRLASNQLFRWFSSGYSYRYKKRPIKERILVSIGSEGRIAPLHTYVFAFPSRSSALPTAILSSRFRLASNQLFRWFSSGYSYRYKKRPIKERILVSIGSEGRIRTNDTRIMIPLL